MKLYGYFRSSASYRVRIALNLKGLDYQQEAVHLLKNGGEQLASAYRQINPDALVPAFEDQGQILTQSLAILEYLDERYPQVPLLPSAALDRAYVRSLALAIACEIHPLNNLRVLKYLTAELKLSDEQKTSWYKHWVEQGLATLEQRLADGPQTGRFCFGDTPGLADCCLVPQIFNAQRFNCDMTALPTIMKIYQNCMELPAFVAASPAQQPDAE